MASQCVGMATYELDYSLASQQLHTSSPCQSYEFFILGSAHTLSRGIWSYIQYATVLRKIHRRVLLLLGEKPPLLPPDTMEGFKESLDQDQPDKFGYDEDTSIESNLNLQKIRLDHLETAINRVTEPVDCKEVYDRIEQMMLEQAMHLEPKEQQQFQERFMEIGNSGVLCCERALEGSERGINLILYRRIKLKVQARLRTEWQSDLSGAQQELSQRFSQLPALG